MLSSLALFILVQMFKKSDNIYTRMALRLIAFPIVNAAVLVLSRRSATTSAKAVDDRTRRSALNKGFMMVLSLISVFLILLLILN